MLIDFFLNVGECCDLTWVRNGLVKWATTCVFSHDERNWMFLNKIWLRKMLKLKVSEKKCPYIFKLSWSVGIKDKRSQDSFEVEFTFGRYKFFKLIWSYF
jgi:hypothetical protein